MAFFDHLPAALKILRGRTGLSQRASAKRVQDRTGASLTQSMLSQWEGGEQRPSLESLGNLLSGFDFGLRDLESALAQASRESRKKEGTPLGIEDQALLLTLRERLRTEPHFRQILEQEIDSAAGLESIQELLQGIEGLRHALHRRAKAMEAKLSPKPGQEK